MLVAMVFLKETLFSKPNVSFLKQFCLSHETLFSKHDFTQAPMRASGYKNVLKRMVLNCIFERHLRASFYKQMF